MSSCIVYSKVVEMKDHIDSTDQRRAWMGVLAKAQKGQAAILLDYAITRPEITWLRPPEIGAVMVRGRAGGTGAPFNVGEMSVTRACLQLGCGTVGHAYIQGRSKADAEVAALIDALMQTDMAPLVQQQVLDPLCEIARMRTATRAAKAAATKVEFFTMATGED